MEGVSIDRSEPHQHDGITPVVVRDVIDIRRVRQQQLSIFDFAPHDQRVRVGREMGREAGDKYAVNSQNRRAIVAGGGFNVRQRQSNCRDEFECSCAYHPR